MINYDDLLNRGYDEDFDESIFREDVSGVEYRGMESYLQEIIDNYEEEVFGEVFTNIGDVTFWREGRIDIMDGYEINNYRIHSVKITDNDIVYFWCSEIDEEEDGEERYFYLQVN